MHYTKPITINLSYWLYVVVQYFCYCVYLTSLVYMLCVSFFFAEYVGRLCVYIGQKAKLPTTNKPWEDQEKQKRLFHKKK